jgi:hypothetical protein
VRSFSREKGLSLVTEMSLIRVKFDWFGSFDLSLKETIADGPEDRLL